MAKSSKVSVLICTYNRHELLEGALRALIDETQEKPDQVVIVNGGNQKADRVVESFQQTHGVELKLIKTDNQNLATSRNVGLPHCTGDVIALTDDDARVFPDWVTQLKRAHEGHPEAGAIGGPVFAAADYRFINRIANYVVFSTALRAGYVRHVPGVNSSYKKDAVKKVGFYDETLFRGEDVDFNWRIKKAGYEIFHDSKIRVFHIHRTTWTGLAKQVYMYGRAYYLVRTKWPDMYAIYPRHIKSFRDCLKLCNFLFGMFLEPLAWIKYQSRPTDILLGYPIGVLLALIWRLGMLIERFIYGQRNTKEQRSQK